MLTSPFQKSSYAIITEEGTTDTNYEHVVFNEKGVPVIKGTRFKVVHIVASKMAHGWSPEGIHFQHPDLTMGQIYSALA